MNAGSQPDKEALGRAIAQAREARGLNQSELARALGVTPQAVQKWESGLSSPRPGKIADIAATLEVEPGVFVQYLIELKSPLQPAGNPDLVTAMPASFKRVVPDDETDLEVDRIPYWDAKGSCGGGFLNYEQMPKGHLVKEASFFKRYHLKPDNAVAVYADGNSMANFIVDGDIVIFDRSKTEPRSGKIFLIDHPDGLRIKQLRREIGGAWVLESLNPDKQKYPDERIEPAHGALLKIYGEFVYRQGG